MGGDGLIREVECKIGRALADLSRAAGDRLGRELRLLAPGHRYKPGASVAAVLGVAGGRTGALLEMEMPLDAAVRASDDELAGLLGSLLGAPLAGPTEDRESVSPAGPAVALSPRLWSLEDSEEWSATVFSVAPHPADLKTFRDALTAGEPSALLGQYAVVHRPMRDDPTEDSGLAR